MCVIPFDDMSASSKRIIRASHDQSAAPASNLDHEAPTPLPSWLLLGLCVSPTKGAYSIMRLGAIPDYLPWFGAVSSTLNLNGSHFGCGLSPESIFGIVLASTRLSDIPRVDC